MKLLTLVVLVISTLSLAQAAKEPGHPSRHASVGKSHGAGGTANSSKTSSALAAQLAKIEAEGVHAPASAPGSRPSASAVAKTQPGSRGRNKPMQSSHRPRQGKRTTKRH
jgi:hypothetical protein